MSRFPVALAGNRRMGRVLRPAVLGVAVSLLCVGQPCVAAAPPPLAVRAKTVYVGDGRIVKDGTVLVQDGRITAIGSDRSSRSKAEASLPG